MTSTDNLQLTSVAVAKASSGRIAYAGILLTPYINSYVPDPNRSNHIRKTMIHEIGHSLGLGHPNTDYYPTSADSVMRQGTGYEGYYTPRTHDTNDLSSKY